MKASENEQTVQVRAGEVLVTGDLILPAQPKGLVLFAHGSGSSRFSPRNRYVAEILRRAGFGTFLMDLLTSDEESIDVRTAEFRFDIPLLGRRLMAATDWVANDPSISGLPLGYFGASTGAGAAIVATAERPDRVAAVVSRGGRPDLAGGALSKFSAPILLIVGGDDAPVIRINEEAMRPMQAERELVIVPHAGHLFEEPGTLDEVARLATEWFSRHLPK